MKSKQHKTAVKRTQPKKSAPSLVGLHIATGTIIVFVLVITVALTFNAIQTPQVLGTQTIADEQSAEQPEQNDAITQPPPPPSGQPLFHDGPPQQHEQFGHFSPSGTITPPAGFLEHHRKGTANRPPKPNKHEEMHAHLNGIPDNSSSHSANGEHGNVMPDQAIKMLISKKVLSEVSQHGASSEANQPISITQIHNQTAFAVNGSSQKKVFGIIPVTLPKTVYVSTENGQVIQTQESLFNKLLDALSF